MIENFAKHLDIQYILQKRYQKGNQACPIETQIRSRPDQSSE